MWLGCLALVVVAGVAVGRISGDGENRDAASPDVVIAESEAVSGAFSVVGTVEPGRVTHIAAPFEDVVKKRHVEYGDEVEAGQVLLELDTDELEGRLREARAALMKSARALEDVKGWKNSADVARARRDVISAQLAADEARRRAFETATLLQKGIIPKMEDDAARQEVRMLELQLANAREDLQAILQKGGDEYREIATLEWESASRKLAALSAESQNSVVKAPSAGVVLPLPAGAGPRQAVATAVPVEPGARVGKGQPLFMIADLDMLAVVAKVDELDVGKIEHRMPVEVTGDAFRGLRLKGHVARISGQAATPAGGGGGAFEVRVLIPALTEEERRQIRVGMSARLSISQPRRTNAIVLPLASIQQEEGEPFVWVEDAPGGARRKARVVLGDTTGEGVQIRDGVREGERVLLYVGAGQE